MSSDSNRKTSREHGEGALREFLDSEKPGVLALKGPWGVGKTFIWKKFLEEYRKTANQVGYSYVSLFGINSIAELRHAIFSKHVPLAVDKKKSWSVFGKKHGTGLLKFVDFAPATLGVLKNTEALSEWLQDKILRNFIICIDDLERKEDAVTGSALLGFITSLREERNCKVILIYNDGELSPELNESFGEYREKVIDREITYAPSIEDNFRIIFPEGADAFGISGVPSLRSIVGFGDDTRTLLQIFQSLKVTNIRVFHKTRVALEYFTKYLGTGYPKLYPHFCRQTVKLCCLYYLYGDRWPLEQLV